MGERSSADVLESSGELARLGRRVARSAKDRGVGLSARRDMLPAAAASARQCPDARLVRVEARQYRQSARRAKRVRDEGVGKQRALFSNRIDPRRPKVPGEVALVGRDRVLREVVCEEEEHVRTSLWRALSPRRRRPSTSGIVTRSVATHAGRQGRVAPQLGKRVGLGKQIMHAGHAIGGRPCAGPARRIRRAAAPERGDERRPVPERRGTRCREGRAPRPRCRW